LPRRSSSQIPCCAAWRADPHRCPSRRHCLRRRRHRRGAVGGGPTEGEGQQRLGHGDWRVWKRGQIVMASQLGLEPLRTGRRTSEGAH
ncbi:unnamed protein product, partial [Linum tenue]